jgi:hypothetical protein
MAGLCCSFASPIRHTREKLFHSPISLAIEVTCLKGWSIRSRMRKHPIILLGAVILFPSPSFSQFVDVNDQRLSLVSRSDGTQLTRQLTGPVSLQTSEAGSGVGTQLLIPSSAHTSSFTSLLVILNLGSQTNHVRITAKRPDGSTVGIINTSIPVGGSLRNLDVLGQMGAALGEFGPITVESTNGVSLSAVSEVSSSQGPGGSSPGSIPVQRH